MKLIVCMDDKNGMAFNHRRQSRDRVLAKRIMELTENANALSGRAGSCQSGLPHLRRTKRFLLCGTGEPERI